MSDVRLQHWLSDSTLRTPTKKHLANQQQDKLAAAPVNGMIFLRTILHLPDCVVDHTNILHIHVMRPPVANVTVEALMVPTHQIITAKLQRAPVRNLSQTTKQHRNIDAKVV